MVCYTVNMSIDLRVYKEMEEVLLSQHREHFEAVMGSIPKHSLNCFLVDVEQIEQSLPFYFEKAARSSDDPVYKPIRSVHSSGDISTATGFFSLVDLFQKVYEATEYAAEGECGGMISRQLIENDVHVGFSTYCPTDVPAELISSTKTR